MLVAVVSGARPQFIKLAPIIKGLESVGIKIHHIHTGQHYDAAMSGQIFEDLELDAPATNLEIGSASHAEQTGKMLTLLEKEFLEIKPDAVLVAGDTNSTIAGALAAVKIHLPVIHLEAGLRSNDWLMPEEINRILTDRISTLLVSHTESGVANLLREGVQFDRILLTGDPMVDSILTAAERSEGSIQLELPFEKNEYVLATMHRAENVDKPERLRTIVEVFEQSPLPVVFPAHPRTIKQLNEQDLMKRLEDSPNVQVRDPAGYLEFAFLMKNSKGIITDSGGLQKEAFILQKPCITMRTTSEWVESIAAGANRLLGFDSESILLALNEIKDGKFSVNTKHPYGDGKAGVQIAEEIKTKLESGDLKLHSESQV